MSIQRLISRLMLGAAVLAAGATVPVLAHAGDDYRHHWRHEHRYHGDHNWKHRHHHDHRYCHPRWGKVYERHHAPRVYYAPAYGYHQPREGVTFTYRSYWH